LELASNGDERAILHLNRAVKRDATTELAQRATAVLEEINVEAAQ